MSALKETVVKRGGRTSPYWSGTIRSVELKAANELRFSFSMASKGGGYTNVEMQIGPKDFPTILEAMIIVDRQAAMEAMSQELARQIHSEPEREAKQAAKVNKAIKDAREQARAEIRGRAISRCTFKMRSGDTEKERIVLNGIREIIAEIEANKRDGGS